jgi:hypothetical protein
MSGDQPQQVDRRHPDRLASGLAYTAGYLSIASFAGQLGVSVADLELGTQDVLLVAVSYAFVFAMSVALIGVIFWILIGIGIPSIEHAFHEPDDGTDTKLEDGANPSVPKSDPPPRAKWLKRGLLLLAWFTILVAVLAAPISVLGVAAWLAGFDTDHRGCRQLRQQLDARNVADRTGVFRTRRRLDPLLGRTETDPPPP